MPVFLLWGLLIPQDAEMSDCGRACEELIFVNVLGLHIKPYYTVGSGQYYSTTGVHTYTHIHTHTNTFYKAEITWDLCNRWKWVIWIGLDYRTGTIEEEREKEGKKRQKVEESTGVKESDQDTASTTTPLMTGRHRAGVCLSYVCTIQRHLWECNLFWLSVSPTSLHSSVFTTPTHSLPSPLSEWLTFTEIRLQHHKTSHIPDGERKLTPPPPPSLRLGSFNGGGWRGGGGDGVRGGGVWGLSWRPDLDVMDVSIKDMETRSVTDISIIEIFHCLLPSL